MGVYVGSSKGTAFTGRQFDVYPRVFFLKGPEDLQHPADYDALHVFALYSKLLIDLDDDHSGAHGQHAAKNY